MPDLLIAKTFSFVLLTATLNHSMESCFAIVLNMAFSLYSTFQDTYLKTHLTFMSLWTFWRTLYRQFEANYKRLEEDDKIGGLPMLREKVRRDWWSDMYGAPGDVTGRNFPNPTDTTVHP